MSLTIRAPKVSDIDPCGRIMFEGFKKINESRGYENIEVPDPRIGRQLAAFCIKNPSYWGAVAELDGKVVGSTFTDERNKEICGYASISVDTSIQGRGIGSRLVNAAFERSRSRGSKCIRFLQHTFNNYSLGLYTTLGFKVKELVVLLGSKIMERGSRDIEIRKMTSGDLNECAALCKKVYGFERTGELRDSLYLFNPFVALRDGNITAYVSSPDTWCQNHGVAETDNDMITLLQGIRSEMTKPLYIFVPAKQTEFFRKCLDMGWRLVKPFTLMSIGKYHQPKGCYLTSIVY
jgi:ribosomal protein S18 acetylase RimI-like enzyme